MNPSHRDNAELGRAEGVGSHLVAILVYDGVKLLDVAGPAEVFAEANRLGADYRVALVSPSGADVTTSIGIRIAVDGGPDFQQVPQTFLIAGGDIYPRTAVPRDLVVAAQDLSAGAQRVASICTGAFILAATGLLDGKRATTHWKVAHTLALRHPMIRVEPDAIYVRDGTTYTSAGVSAGIDLALALVEEDHGPDRARRVPPAGRWPVAVLCTVAGSATANAGAAKHRRSRHSRPVGEPFPYRARGSLESELSAPLSSVPLRTVDHPRQVRRIDPLRHRQGTSGPGVHRHPGRGASRLSQLREPAQGVCPRSGNVPSRLPAPVPHCAPKRECYR
jgi:putative intracellular protease/amidase